jgi:hypothetical protein
VLWSDFSGGSLELLQVAMVASLAVLVQNPAQPYRWGFEK